MDRQINSRNVQGSSEPSSPRPEPDENRAPGHAPDAAPPVRVWHRRYSPHRWHESLQNRASRLRDEAVGENRRQLYPLSLPKIGLNRNVLAYSETFTCVQLVYYRHYAQSRSEEHTSELQ